MAETPAERMHNRILNGAAFSTHDVTAEAFEQVARNAGTLQLADVKYALYRLQILEQPKKKP